MYNYNNPKNKHGASLKKYSVALKARPLNSRALPVL